MAYRRNSLLRNKLPRGGSGTRDDLLLIDHAQLMWEVECDREKRYMARGRFIVASTSTLVALVSLTLITGDPIDAIALVPQNQTLEASDPATRMLLQPVVIVGQLFGHQIETLREALAYLFFFGSFVMASGLLLTVSSALFYLRHREEDSAVLQGATDFDSVAATWDNRQPQLQALNPSYLFDVLRDEHQRSLPILRWFLKLLARQGVLLRAYANLTLVQGLIGLVMRGEDKLRRKFRKSLRRHERLRPLLLPLSYSRQWTRRAIASHELRPRVDREAVWRKVVPYLDKGGGDSIPMMSTGRSDTLRPTVESRVVGAFASRILAWCLFSTSGAVFWAVFKPHTSVEQSVIWLVATLVGVAACLTLGWVGALSSERVSRRLEEAYCRTNAEFVVLEALRHEVRSRLSSIVRFPRILWFAWRNELIRCSNGSSEDTRDPDSRRREAKECRDERRRRLRAARNDLADVAVLAPSFYLQYPKAFVERYGGQHETTSDTTNYAGEKQRFKDLDRKSQRSRDFPFTPRGWRPFISVYFSAQQLRVSNWNLWFRVKKAERRFVSAVFLIGAAVLLAILARGAAKLEAPPGNRVHFGDDRGQPVPALRLSDDAADPQPSPTDLSPGAPNWSVPSRPAPASGLFSR